MICNKSLCMYMRACVCVCVCVCVAVVVVSFLLLFLVTFEHNSELFTLKEILAKIELLF